MDRISDFQAPDMTEVVLVLHFVGKLTYHIEKASEFIQISFLGEPKASTPRKHSAPGAMSAYHGLHPKRCISGDIPMKRDLNT